MVAVLAKMLLDSDNGTSNLETGELPEELQLYKNDLDFPKFNYLICAPQLSRLIKQLITEINTKKKEKNEMVYTSILIMSSVSNTHCVYGRKLR